MKYLKDSLDSRPDVVTGFGTLHLCCGQDPGHHFPLKDVIDCNRNVVCVGPLLCPQVCGYSVVSSLQ